MQRLVLKGLSILIYFVLLGVDLASCEAPAGSILVFQKGEGGYYCHKIPYLFRTINNTLIALAEGRGRDGRTTCDDFTGTDLVMKRSYDNGSTWTPLQLFYSNSSATESNVIGNAAPVQDQRTGRIWMPFCRNNVEVFISYSDDDGNSWSDPVYHPELTHEDWKWIGLGPPAGIQLSSGRLLLPAYHTVKWKGDGCDSRGHTIYSDDAGNTWKIGSEEFGAPYLANECQAVELQNGSVLINARTVSNNRVQVVSNDGGMTFDAPYIVSGLTQPLEGCEGSIVRDPVSGRLYFSDPSSLSPVRLSLTIYQSSDEGLTWTPLTVVDKGAVAYSALVVFPPSNNEADPTNATSQRSGLGLLYERSNTIQLVFDPDEIRFWRVL